MTTATEINLSTPKKHSSTTEFTLSEDSSIEIQPDLRSTPPRWVYGTSVNRPSSVSRTNTASSLVGRGNVVAVPQPEIIQDQLFPVTDDLQLKIQYYRNRVTDILTTPKSELPKKQPLLVITGPTYVSDFQQVRACSQWIGGKLGKTFNQLPAVPELIKPLYQSKARPENLLLSIRSNLTKYNYNTSDPTLKTDSSIMTLEVEKGVPVCRALLCELAEVCPIVGQTSDTITPQYFSDLFCLGLVGSTLIESQLHRELVSGLSYPVGFVALDSNLPFNKEMYVHRVTSALDAMYASSQQHHFLSITKVGTVAVIGTVGNEETFIILSVNEELSFDDLNIIIKKVYLYPNGNFKAPKIMLDVGKLSNGNYNRRLALVKEVLHNDDTRNTVVGVLIDSGDHYAPTGTSIDLSEQVDNEEYDIEDHQELIDLQKYFVHRRLNKGNSVSSLSSLMKNSSISSLASLTEEDPLQYEHFVNADRFIQELDEINKD